MEFAPLPPDETERIKNLDSYHLLDTPFEPVYDEIASLAAKICGVPYALISLVDRNRQWFKAAYGLKNVRETPRDISFCGHAILHDEVFHVPDTHQDERFHDNPFVTGELGIRVYAGMPLTSQEGHKLGTLCVLSDQPARLSDWQLESTKQLSHVITTLFQARKKEATLAVLGQVLDQLNDEVILADHQSLTCLYANAAAQKAYALPLPAMRKMQLPELMRAASTPGPQQEIEALQRGEKPGSVLELQRPGADGQAEPAAIEMRLQSLRNENGGMIVAISHDISKQLEQANARMQQDLQRNNRDLSQAYRLLSEEVKIAREMQLRFLPSPKSIGPLRFDWLFRASNYLGGDIFDYFPLGRKYLCFYVIDVSGHGVASALLAFTAQRQLFAARSEMLTLIHRFSGNLAKAASAFVQYFNREFVSINESSLYATMVFGLSDAATGDLALVQAGHPPPLLLNGHGTEITPIGSGGVPIGILKDVEYESHALTLQPGARLHLYSDGIPECANPAGEMFGDERMRQLLAGLRHAPLEQVREAMDHALREWKDGKAGFEDDLTFVTLERLALGSS